MDLEKIFKPHAVVVVGVSHSNPFNPSNIIFKKFLYEYEVKTFAINPKGGFIEGCRVYRNFDELSGEIIDLAIIAVRATLVPSVLEACATFGIKGAIIISAGFGETESEEGQKLQDQIVVIAKKYDLAVIGPNCIGIYHPPFIDTFFLPSERISAPRPGTIAVISQSGAWLVDQIIEKFSINNIGISAAISIGNKAVTTELDLIEYFKNDPKTKAIFFYLEGFREFEGRNFVKKARECAKIKPVVVFKGGQSEAGRRATISHTSSLAGSQAVTSDIFKQFNIIEARTEKEMMAFAKAFSSLHFPIREGRVLILSVSGGHGVVTTDVCTRYGFQVPLLSEEHQEKVRELMTEEYRSLIALQNPIDLTASAQDKDFEKILDYVLDLQEFDSVILCLLPYTVGISFQIGARLAVTIKNHQKTVVAYFPRLERYEVIIRGFELNNIPVADSIEEAVQILYGIRLRTLFLD